MDCMVSPNSSTCPMPDPPDQTHGSFLFTFVVSMVLVLSVCVWFGKAFFLPHIHWYVLFVRETLRTIFLDDTNSLSVEALEQEASQRSKSNLRTSSPKVNETSIKPTCVEPTSQTKNVLKKETSKPKQAGSVIQAKQESTTSLKPSPSKATNEAVREQFGKLCKLLENPGWWMVTLRKEELIARRCRPHEKLSPGEFKLRAKKIGEVPVFGHFNKLAPAQADLMNVYRREIERLFEDPFIQKSIGPSQDEILKRIRHCAELAQKEKLRREVEAELDELPDFNDLLQEMKRDMKTD